MECVFSVKVMFPLAWFVIVVFCLILILASWFQPCICRAPWSATISNRLCSKTEPVRLPTSASGEMSGVGSSFTFQIVSRSCLVFYFALIPLMFPLYLIIASVSGRVMCIARAPTHFPCFCKQPGVAWSLSSPSLALSLSGFPLLLFWIVYQSMFLFFFGFVFFWLLFFVWVWGGGPLPSLLPQIAVTGGLP